MTLLDVIFAVAILVSAGLATKRGFIREFITLVAMALAIVLAVLLYRMVLVPAGAGLIGSVLTTFGTFVVALIVLIFMARRISDAIDADQAVLNRLLGLLLGLARGVVLIAFGLAYVEWIMDATGRPNWITGAMTAGMVRDAGQRLMAILPETEILVAVALGTYISLFISFAAVLIGRRPAQPRPA